MNEPIGQSEAVISPFWNMYEAAAYCRVSVATIRTLLRTKKIKSRQMGSQWRILKADLDSYLGMGPEELRRKAR